MSVRTCYHCERCRVNLDALVCPRCGRLTAVGLLAQPKVRRPVDRDEAFIETYRCGVKLIRDGGVDVEAS